MLLHLICVPSTSRCCHEMEFKRTWLNGKKNRLLLSIVLEAWRIEEPSLALPSATSHIYSKNISSAACQS